MWSFTRAGYETLARIFCVWIWRLGLNRMTAGNISFGERTPATCSVTNILHSYLLEFHAETIWKSLEDDGSPQLLGS